MPCSPQLYADHMFRVRCELAGEVTVAAPDIKDSVGSGGDCSEEQRVVLDVVVPPLGTGMSGDDVPRS